MPPIDAVIFDLDGTLADSLADIGEAMNEMLASHGLPTHGLDAYKTFVGEGVENLTRRALPEEQRGELARYLDDYRARYARRLANQTRPYPGVPELLDALVERKLALAVLSNKRDDFTVELVRQLFSRWPFRVVRGERAGTPRKPDPTAALEVAAELGVAPAHVAFVGDTAIDIKTARAAGMLAVGVTWGFRPERELEAAGAHVVIRRPEQLLSEVAVRSVAVRSV